MQIKIILFDIDGVLIRLPYYFSVELEKQGYKNVEKTLNSFFKGENNYKRAEGKANTEKMILPYLQKFGWQKTAKDYLLQQFQFEKKYLDQNLISIVKKLKKQDVICCLATDQEEIRAKFLLDDMKFKNIFDKHFISCYIGHRKCHDEFWTYVLKELKKEFKELKAHEIIFFDDIQKNIDTAAKFGIQAFLFTSVSQFKKNLTTLNFENIICETRT